MLCFSNAIFEWSQFVAKLALLYEFCIVFLGFRVGIEVTIILSAKGGREEFFC